MSANDFGTKMGKPILYQEDYRGLKLCRPCWNSDHFHENPNTKSGRPLVCQCRLGECECPCSRMEQNRADFNYQLRELQKKNKKAQTSILDNCQALQIGPNS